MKNPRLRKPGAFAYAPEFVRDSEGNLQNRQLHQSAWFHKAQHAIGRENMVLAAVSNCDGVMVTKKHETIFFYLRLGNATAPVCFDPSCTQLIATVPDIAQETGMSDDTYYRAKARLFHLCIEKIFARFNEASHE